MKQDREKEAMTTMGANADFGELANRAAAWLRRTQIKNLLGPTPDDHTYGDMNFGRFVFNYRTTDRKLLYLGSNWLSGMSIYGLTLSRDYAGDETCLEAAENGAYYLYCLQRLEPWDEKSYGAFAETSPRDRWCHPRDALSAAWGLTRLYMATGKEAYLRRAELFADWHMKRAMTPAGYPKWTVYFDDRKDVEFLGSFQAGGALFYYDLYRVTREPKYREAMLRILDFFAANFWDDANGLIIKYDPETGYKGDSQGDEAWSDMHKYNDDFNAIALMNAYAETGDETYARFVRRYLDWALSKQHADGSFGLYRLSVSSCVAALNLLNGHLIFGKAEYLDAAYKAVRHMLKSVLLDPSRSDIDGATLGLLHCDVAPNNDVISLRVTMYSLYTFTLFDLFEKRVKDRKTPSPIDDKLRNNPMLIGTRFLKT